MPQPEPSCSKAHSLRVHNLRDRRLLRRLGSRSHVCHELSDACFWNRQIFHPGSLPRPLAKMRIRLVHIGFQVQSIESLGLFRTRNESDSQLRQMAFEDCVVPLIWWPLWGYNIGEFFQNSLLGISELLSAGVIDRSRVELVPEVGGWPLRDFQLQMLQAFTSHPVRTAGQLGPRCEKGPAARRRFTACPAPRCYKRLLVCKFRDVYEPLPPVAPWTAAQAVVRNLERTAKRALKPPAPASSRPFTVIFASRTAVNTHNGARLLSNEGELLEVCRRWRPPVACVPGPGASSDANGTPGRETRCETYGFGRRGFRRDVRRVRDANALVGTHSAALVHAMFMSRGSALIEVRPYGFTGRWPDQYHLAMAQRENATHAFVLQTEDRHLSSPVPPANVSAWDARPLNTYVQPAAFERALAAAACARGEGEAARAARRVPTVPAPGATTPFAYAELGSIVIENGRRSEDEKMR